MSKISTETQAVDFVRAARADRTPFEIVAGGTRRGVGKPVGDIPMLDVSGLSGVIKYEPGELILTAAPSTPLTEINAVLAQKNQRLGFDPADWSRLLGSPKGSNNGVATLAGAASCDASGSGKLRHGGARDSLLGFAAVNGQGEAFRGGGKVVKNVTGFDLPKLVCGAFGTLCLLTELTFRVFPRPSHSTILKLDGVAPEIGFAMLRKVALSALEPGGLAYLPHGDVGTALIKLEGAAEPLAQKVALAHGLLGHDLSQTEDDGVFARIGSGEMFADAVGDIWRVLIPQSEAPKVAKTLNAAHWLGDWAGGVIWLAAAPTDAARVRAIAVAHQGQAMLLRASAASRATHGLFAPQPPALAALSRSVKAAFDPLNLFNPGRL